MVVATQPIPLDKKDALRHLEKTNPETLALANDWEDIATKVVRTQEKIKECVMDFISVSPLTLACRLSSTEPDSQTLGMVHLHNRTSFTFFMQVEYSCTPKRHS
jgi:U3 small nucleolar RNA-associated protein 3